MIPLVVRSHYSLMQGTTSVRHLCHAAKNMGYRQLALTDTDNLYGLWPFLTECRRQGIRPIVGAEVSDPNRDHRAVCLVRNHHGYGNLCRLLTLRHMDKTFNLETRLPLYADGLIVLTTRAHLLTSWHRAGVNVVAAVPGRPLPETHPLCRRARALNLPMAAIPDSYFLYPDDIKVHRLLRAISLNSTFSRLRPEETAPAEAWLAPPAEYMRRFASRPHLIRATGSLAGQIEFTGPDFGLTLPPWADSKRQDAAICLRQAAYQGAQKRYGRDLPEPVVDRLEHELHIINKMGFSTYFLVVHDIISLCRSKRICGRGSGAASLVAYCLGITNVCPVKHSLYFERFLNPGRSDPPDIDVDFAWDERDEVLNTVLEKYAGRAAMVCNHVLFQPRMAVRETAKVFGLTDTEIGQVAKRMPWLWRWQTTSDESAGSLLDRLKARPEAKHLDFLEPWPEIFSLAQKIIGIPRYLSVHPGGVVITPDAIDQYVPIERAPKGVPILQWEKDSVEEAGLVKIDLLGNRSLGVIRDAIENIKANGCHFDDFHWEPEDDLATQEAIRQGQTMGCFYIESPAMRQLHKKAGVGDFEHLVIHSSIIRPAANEFIREYIRRLHGGPWEPIHPLLADVLSETFGIMVYQEDVSRVAVSLAGFSHADADGLRKIMSKKDKFHGLQDYYDRFLTGATARGVKKKQVDNIWDMMMSFSGYSFCKPHSASYARVSFQAAYLKVHFPAEFMAAVISNQGGFYSTFAYVSESRRMGMNIIAPDINKSDIGWRGKDSSIQTGLMAIRDLSKNTMARIIQQRRIKKFTGLADFIRRVRPDENEVKALIHSGALDTLSPYQNRTSLLWELAAIQQRRTEEMARDVDLFNPAATAPPPPALPAENPLIRLQREFDALGFLCDQHPMVLYDETAKKRQAIKIARLPQFIGRRVRLVAWLITGKTVLTKQGDPMKFFSFEDDSGIVETTFFPNAYRSFCHMIDYNRPYLLYGKVEQDWGALSLTVESAERLPERL